MSAAEEALWARLGAAPFGATFLSRMPVGRFAAGFGSYAAKVIVEIDGDAHDRHRGDAHTRDAAFESAGYLVLRFSEDEVLGDIDAVIDQIGRAMAAWSG